jgi:hypothetical protein
MVESTILKRSQGKGQIKDPSVWGLGVRSITSPRKTIGLYWKYYTAASYCKTMFIIITQLYVSDGRNRLKHVVHANAWCVCKPELCRLHNNNNKPIIVAARSKA